MHPTIIFDAAPGPPPDAPTPTEHPTRVQIVAWAALMVLSLVLILHGFNTFQIGAYGDDAEYTILARSFVYGPHFGLISGPGEPGPTRYPFGFPLLLSGFVRAFPHSPNALKALSTLATMANGALLFWGWRGLTRRASHHYALGISALYLLSPLVISQARMVMSEPIFTTGCLTTLLLAERTARGREGRGWTFWLALALLLTTFIRTIGAVLIPVVIGYVLWRRGRAMLKPLALTLAQMVLLTGIILALTPLGVRDLVPLDYAHQFQMKLPNGQPTPESHLGYRLKLGLSQYFGSDIAQTVVPLGGGAREASLMRRLGLPELMSAFGWLISALVLLGGARWARREGISAFLLFAVAYFCGIVLWPWRGPRFLYAIQPQIAFGLTLGLESALWAVMNLVAPRDVRQRLVSAALAASVLLLSVSLALKDSRPQESRDFTGDLPARTLWIREHAPPAAVIMTYELHTDYLYSGHKTVGILDSYPDPEALAAGIAEEQASYLVVAPQTVWQNHYTPRDDARTARLDSQAQALAARHRLRLVATAPDVAARIYQVIPPPGTPSETPAPAQ